MPNLVNVDVSPNQQVITLQIAQADAPTLTDEQPLGLVWTQLPGVPDQVLLLLLADPAHGFAVQVEIPAHSTGLVEVQIGADLGVPIANDQQLTVVPLPIPGVVLALLRGGA